jgi:serine/threonine protein phosphatase PrpC
LRPSGPGWILACTDGLWNYCSEASELARLMAQSAQAAGGSPSGVAARLVAWANEQGGRDNITVALIRVT